MHATAAPSLTPPLAFPRFPPPGRDKIAAALLRAGADPSARPGSEGGRDDAVACLAKLRLPTQVPPALQRTVMMQARGESGGGEREEGGGEREEGGGREGGGRGARCLMHESGPGKMQNTPLHIPAMRAR